MEETKEEEESAYVLTSNSHLVAAVENSNFVISLTSINECFTYGKANPLGHGIPNGNNSPTAALGQQDRHENAVTHKLATCRRRAELAVAKLVGLEERGLPRTWGHTCLLPLVSMRFPWQSRAQEPTGSAGHTCRRNSAPLPAFSDKRSVYSRRADSCPRATFIYKMLVKLLTVGAVEEKLREKLTFLDLAGAHSTGAGPLFINSIICLLVDLFMTSGLFTGHCF